MQPDLKLGKHKIPVVNDAKFLGLYWDRKLTWNAHISQLKVKATNSLNIVRTLSGHTCVADLETLMRGDDTTKAGLRVHSVRGCE